MISAYISCAPTVLAARSSWTALPGFESPATSVARVNTVTMKMLGPGGSGRHIRGGSGGGRFGAGGGSGHIGNGGRSSDGKGPTGGTGGPGSLSGDSNPFSKLASYYAHNLRDHPITTKVITSLIGFAVGSLIIEGKGLGSVDWRPVAVVAATGALVHGLGGHYYYGASERALPGIEITKLAGKTAIDFLLWLPFISLSLVYVRDLSQGKSKSRKSLEETVKSWALPSPIWLAVSAAMFRFVGVHERTLYYNAALLSFAVIKRVADASASSPTLDK